MNKPTVEILCRTCGQKTGYRTTYVCSVCNKEYSITRKGKPKGIAKNRMYCSDACRSKAYRDRHDVSIPAMRKKIAELEAKLEAKE